MSFTTVVWPYNAVEGMEPDVISAEVESGPRSYYLRGVNMGVHVSGVYLEGSICSFGGLYSRGEERKDGKWLSAECGRWTNLDQRSWNDAVD
ncbi:MAG: hypothetical protein CL912_30885 [Deltaproteobacteria bacterium]|nr:hypothetical protein [Deltaproteobacteria bacterium]